MNWLDFFLLLWLVISLASGFRLGFVYKAGTTIGFFFGIWLASRWTPELVARFPVGPVMTASLFLLILAMVSKLFGIGAMALNKAFKLVAIIPFIKMFNRILGGVLSVALSCFILSAGLFLTDQLVKEGKVQEGIRQSKLSQPLKQLSVFYVPLLSDRLEEYVDSVNKK